MSERLTPEQEQARIKSAVDELNSAPLVEVSVWAEHGQEHFHPDVGSYWKPRHIRVEGDMDDSAVLHVLSSVMDEHGLKVHKHHGVEEHGDDWARLVIDDSGGSL